MRGSSGTICFKNPSNGIRSSKLNITDARGSGGAELLQNYSANDDFSCKTKVDKLANRDWNDLDLERYCGLIFV